VSGRSAAVDLALDERVDQIADPRPDLRGVLGRGPEVHAGQDPSTCLTDKQVAAVRKIWDGPRNSKGERVYAPYVRGAESGNGAWERYVTGDRSRDGRHFLLADGFLKYVVFQDPGYDFRRFDLQEHWTIPKLNEPGNLASFVAEALAASWVIKDPATRQRLQEMACAQLDNLIGRNPRMAASPHHPEKGFPLVERGWPKGHPDNICARLETTRGSLSASPGSEMYPFNPGGAFRHAEGWVNFNAAWNVALAYLKWDSDQAR